MLSSSHLAVIALGTVLVLWATPAYAQVPPLEQKDCTLLGLFCPTTAAATENALVNRLRNLVVPAISLAAIIATAAIVYGGVKYILSSGDEEGAKRARNIIIAAILGLLAVGIAGIVINALLNVENVPKPPVFKPPAPNP